MSDDMNEKIRAVEKKIREGADAISEENRIAAEKEEKEMIEQSWKEKEEDEMEEKI